MAVEIVVERTPNPNSLKFTVNQPVTAKGISVTSRETATAHPLAHKLFEVPGVKGLYLMNNFISVTKEPSAQWEMMVPALQTVVAEHFATT